jgi:hypothetical protein
VEGILDLGMECIGQFVGEAAVKGLTNEGLDGGDECAVTREPDRLMGPQAGVVEVGGFSKSVVTAAMSIAGKVVEEFEFAKDGEIGSGAEGLLQFGERRDFMAQQVLAEDLGIERERSHNVIVPSGQAF